MEKPIDVLLIGLGVVGREAANALLGRTGIRLVGAVDADPAKAERDLGEVLGRKDRLGLKVMADVAEAAASLRADIAVHFVNSLLEEAAAQLDPLLKAGLDVVSANEELGNAYAAKPSLASRLDRLAVQNNATVLGTGLSPGFTSDYMILAMTAPCRDVRRIRYRRVSDFRPYIGGIVSRHFGFGLSKAEFAQGLASGEVIGHTGFVESVRTIAASLGWKIDRLERTVEPACDASGRFAGTLTAVRAFSGKEERLSLEMNASVAEEVERSDHLEIDAIPPIDMVVRPQIPSIPATANAVINAIPHVINAAPGFMTVADLPLVHALDGDARSLLRRSRGHERVA
ncbi:MAG: NAD(P)H-dependent amine dehydrogenase family protein [Alphaproteobacteria bacterium]